MPREELNNERPGAAPASGFAPPPHMDVVAERKIAKEFYDAHKYVPQSIGEDAPGKIAGVRSRVFWNVTDITQFVSKRSDPSRRIALMPGDCVVGAEYERYTKMFGGPLSETRPTKVEARSHRDCTYFDARGRMDGDVAKAARDVVKTSPSVAKAKAKSGGRVGQR